MGRAFIAYARLFRLSGLIGFSMAPVFGALAQVGIDIPLLTVFLLLSLGVFKSIHGCVMNDIFDIEVDKLSDDPNRRPLVTGEISKTKAYLISLLTIILAFGVLFGYFYKNQPSFYYSIICIVIAAAIGNIYNKYGKKFIGSDFLVGFSEALFVLVGAYLVTPTEELSVLTWAVFFLIFTQYLFMNMIIGGLKDADHDYLFKAKNVAIKTGVKVSKDKTLYLPKSFLGIALIIRIFSASMVFIPFAFFNETFKIWEISLMVILVSIVLLLTVQVLRLKTLKNRKKILGLFAVQGVLRYSYIPFLLMPIIRLPYSLVLIGLPLLWFVIITIFSGQDIAPNL